MNVLHVLLVLKQMQQELVVIFVFLVNSHLMHLNAKDVQLVQFLTYLVLLHVTSVHAVKKQIQLGLVVIFVHLVNFLAVMVNAKIVL